MALNAPWGWGVSGRGWAFCLFNSTGRLLQCWILLVRISLFPCVKWEPGTCSRFQWETFHSSHSQSPIGRCSRNLTSETSGESFTRKANILQMLLTGRLWGRPPVRSILQAAHSPSLRGWGLASAPPEECAAWEPLLMGGLRQRLSLRSGSQASH